MGSALFVSGEDVVYPVTGDIEFIEEVDYLTAGVTENGIASLFDEGLDNYLCT